MVPVLNLTSFPLLIILFGLGCCVFFYSLEECLHLWFILEVGELSKDLIMTDFQNG